MKAIWEKIPSDYKRLIVITLTIIFVAGIIYLLTPTQEIEKKKKREESITHLLTDINTRDINMNNLSAKLKQFELNAQRLEKQVEQLQQQLKNSSLNEDDYFNAPVHSSFDSTSFLGMPTNVEVPIIQENRRSLITNNSKISSTPEELNDSEVHLNFFSSTSIGEGNSHPNDTSKEEQEFLLDDSNLDELYSDHHAMNEGFLASFALNEASSPEYQSSFDVKSPQNGHSFKPFEPSNSSEILQIRTFVEDKNLPEIPKLKLVAGSILSGTLITGMDAPTHDLARKEPFPALLRIEKEAIMPNHHFSDIRFCFLVMGGYGDLSSERAYLRAETLSCIFEDDRVVETPLEAYAVGEDGKTGIRGRLVSKQGQLVAKSLMAGFLQGLAGAFDVNPVPTIQTSDIGTKPIYQNMMSQEALEGAALKGSAKALDRVAKFYLDMAQNMFPVIEIDASRQIEMIVTRGTTF
ncbi:TraB/VirB10 family protein [Thorsellia kenyensis]|uniref:TraB/VirB10 family protein n=1 Tax=Thorsellia kenyensis TaxID=1549888 RepID=A0ABV6CDB1_9GAMM